jgi:putative flippase GtrA
VGQAVARNTRMKFYYHVHSYFRDHMPRTYEYVYAKKKIAKYIFSGGIATATNLLVLLTLTELFHVYYLASSVIAFIISIVASFSMQKFWTFGDHSRDNVHTQFALYIVVILVNLVLNTFLVYAFVEWLRLWYFAAQFLAGAIIALISFFAYGNLVFKRPPYES